MLFGILLQFASDPLYRNIYKYINIYICIVYLHISLPMVTSPGAAIWALAYGGLVRAINLIMAILSKDGSSC